MKAFILSQRGADGAHYGTAEKPQRGDAEVLIRMLAASLNRVDLYMRDSGAGISHSLPQIMGIDGVGEVVEAPAESNLATGQRVILYPYEYCGTCPHCLAGDQPLCLSARILGEHRDGTLAEYVSLPARSVLPLSPEVDPTEAAALGVAYLTAWRMVFGKAPFSPGQTVLIQGAGGGVSFAAAQLAQMAGARVIVTTTGEDKLTKCRKAGFHAVDHTGNALDEILDLTQGNGTDLVIDNVGEATWGLSLRVARRGGNLVTCGATTGAQPGADLHRLFVRQLSIHGSTMGSLTEFERLIACYENGAFRIPIDSTYALEDTAAGLQRLSAPDRFGKIVISIAAPSSTGDTP